jgi:hypothetical protein
MPTIAPAAAPEAAVTHVGFDPAEIAALLADARERTLLLISTLPEERLFRQHDRLMSPVAWDLGHIAHFEELWLLRNLEGPVRFGEMPGMFNPFENPRATRGELALPDYAETLAVMADVRRRVLQTLDATSASSDPLLHGGYVYRMVAQHEYQHNETILQALQLLDDPPYRAPRAIAPPEGRAVDADGDGFVRFNGGRVEIGTDDRTAAYDNERPRHAVELRPFRIGAAPVTNGEYLRFMDDGGYDDERHWSDAGWKWRQDAAPRPRSSGDAMRRVRGRCARWTSSHRRTRCAPSATSAGTRRRRSPAGPAHACRRSRSGRPPPRGTPRKTARAAIPGATSRRPRCTPTSTSSPSAPRRSVPTRATSRPSAVTG